MPFADPGVQAHLDSLYGRFVELRQHLVTVHGNPAAPRNKGGQEGAHERAHKGSDREVDSE